MKRSAGARLPWACSTSEATRESVESAAGRVARAMSAPVVFSVPANSSSPGALSTGTDSPVIGAWSTLECPARHHRVERDPLAGPDADQRADGDGRDVDELLARRRSARGRGWGRGPSATRRPGGCARAPSPPGRCRPRTARAPTRPRRTRRCRPRRPPRAPSARSCPAAGGAGRAPRRARSASRRPPSRAGTAARPRRRGADASEATTATASRRDRERGRERARIAAPERRVVVLDRARGRAAPGSPPGRRRG